MNRQPHPLVRPNPHARFIAIAGLIAVLALLWLMPKRTDAAGLMVADGQFGGVFEIQEHAVDVTINNGIAVTEIEQTFVNTENRQLEALYTFPVPKGASVANFSMWIDGREMVGEVLEKERAREIYESYKQTRRDPGLLEQVDYKTFEMRIFPVPPRGEQRIRLTYYQELDFDHNEASYVYPLATVARQDIDQRTTGRFALNMRVKSEIPIIEMQSPSHPDQFVMSQYNDHVHEASFEIDGGDLSRDLVINYRLARPKTGLDIITSNPPGEDGYFLLTLTAGEELAKLDRGMDYVFVLDISGSMQNDGKLGLSTQSIAAFIDQLGPNDRFEVMTFNTRPVTLFNDLREATDADKQQAHQFLDSQQARGGTILASAMTTAYKYGNPDRPLNVVVLSDGMTEQAERRRLLELIEQRPSQARVFAIGVGNEVNRPLLRRMAEDAGGLAAFVSRGADFERQAKAFRRKLLRPVASDVQITFSGVDVYDREPRDLANLYHGAPLRLYGRYRDSGDAQVSIRANVLGKPIERRATLELPRTDGGNPEIERMWAWHRVQRLLGEADRAGSRDQVINQIVTLGETYSIATEYTSFIVLENDEEYRRWKIERRNALRLARDREKQETVERQLDQLRQQAMNNLGPNATPAPTDSDQRLASAAKDERPQVRTQSPDNQPSNRPSRGVDLNLPGGGALDPVSGAIALGVGGLAWAGARRRRRKANEAASQ